MLTQAQAELDELLMASLNLPNATCEIGRIQLGFRDLQKAASSRVTSKEADAKAHYLLAGSGFNAEQIVAEIKNIHFDFHPSTAASGVQHYLFTKKQDNVIHSIEKLVTIATKEFDASMSSKINIEWSQSRKRQVYELLNYEPSRGSKQQALAPLVNTRIGKKILGDLPKSAVPLSVIHKALAYAQGLEGTGDFCARMADVASKWDIGLGEGWSALKLLCKDRKFRQPRPPLEDLISKSRQFLELQFRQYIEEEVDLRRKDANLGGVPSWKNKIRAFVDLKFKESPGVEVINKTPIWAYLYFLVRCGLSQDALAVIKERKDIFEYVETGFASYFSAYVTSGGVLNSTYQQLVAAEYASSFRPGTIFDPFKQALYKIIGRCDMSIKVLDVANTTEDWLWLQFVLAQSGTDYTVQDVQEYVLKAGPATFDPAGSDPAKYFTLLVLVSCYEEAVTYLQSSHEVSAVHYALVLSWYGLLNLTKAIPQESGNYNLALAVGHYTRFFRLNHPLAAVNYFCTLAEVGPLYRDWMYEAIQELALETRAYVELYGDSLAMQQGYVENNLEALGIENHTQYLKTIVVPTAEKSAQDGRITDAIVLYQLGEQYDKVLNMVNFVLGETLSSTPLGETVYSAESAESSIVKSDHPIQLARNLLKVQNDHPLILQTVGISNRRITETLLTISEAINALARQAWTDCLEKVDATRLLPSTPVDDFALTSQLAQQFVNLDHSLTKNIPHLLEMVLESCIHIVRDLRSHGNASADLLNQYKARASNCIIYAGLIQYHMPAAVYSRLTQLEAQLNF